jgi:hypothetical protein
MIAPLVVAMPDVVLELKYPYLTTRASYAFSIAIGII